MGRVETIVIEGFDLRFNSLDHGPPHFHVRKPDAWEARVYILDTTPKSLSYDIKWPRGVTMPTRTARTLREEVARNRDALLLEWETKVQTKGVH